VAKIVGIVSDIHYAGASEQARGNDYEYRGIRNPLVRNLLRLHRHYIWMRAPLQNNHLLDPFLARVKDFDYVVANGDYTCNTAFLGLSDQPARESAAECIGKLRSACGDRFFATFGDHEFGKMSLIADRGGMRLESFLRASEIGLKRFWRFEIGLYVIVGITSSLVAFPVMEPDTVPEERAEWQRLRNEHLQEIRTAFESLLPAQRVLLFCHDPSALPFLAREQAVRVRLPQLEQTVVGHLHSNLILSASRALAGIPKISFLGHTAARWTEALREAKCWRDFKLRLCPALAGIQLLRDGGYLTAEIDPEARQPIAFRFHPVPCGSGSE
jgi:hypothetical protein